ncbi:response regulator [Ruegeria aquimaris]|uniref:Response regulator n=1 Tax=Ruegeria aquimaris TaxID=2984333 RepID=A0ABT3ADJ8_9RHOB|nr:response regulator [Ruegeria sp. XHP0148]MCV2886748.1 response regulator [Ruegeria sp. XHP0148]
MRILAVDDEPSILELLTQILAAFGYDDVVTAANGRAALQILGSEPEPFDCLLLDVQMPQMNGIDLCQEVRKLPDYRFTPVIMVTAMVQKQYIDHAFDAGATDYVTKPFEFDDLRQRLSDAYRMAAERKSAILAMEAIEAAQDQDGSDREFHLSDPIYIDGVPGCFGMPEFENYVFKISTAHPLHSSVLAVKVEEAERIFETGSSADFRRAMSFAGKAIMEKTDGARNFAAYWGNGVFLVVLDSDAAFDSRRLAGEVTTLTSAVGRDVPEVASVSLRVGETVPLKAANKLEALFLVDKAVESAEALSYSMSKVS